MKRASRSKQLAITVAVFLSTAATPAQNQVQEPTAADNCQHASTASAMRACANASYKSAEHELDSAYQRLFQRLDNSQREKLRVAQRAWLQYREANAQFRASLAEGGTLAPLIRTSVLADMTKARTAELQNTNLP